MKNITNKILGLMLLGLPLAAMTSCSDSYMEDINTDSTKSDKIDPNAQLTTGLLQVYGDFGLMDCVRCYITGFTQHLAGGWNVSNYAGAVHAEDDMSSSVWNKLYNVGLKNVVDGIYNSEDKPNLNAALRIQRVYMMSILTDLHGDIPCSEAELGYIKGISNPKYDKQEDVYNWMFEELDACINQLGTGDDIITGDVTTLAGDPAQWKKYANSLRMRFAMRISDVDPAKAKAEFEKSLSADCGYVESVDNDVRVKYIDGPFTLYDGARDLDFRVNAFAEMLYGQDQTSPTMICATLYEMFRETNDPRLMRICRHYNNVKRASDKADELWNLDYTTEVMQFIADKPLDAGFSYACVPGAAWYSAPIAIGNPTWNTKWVEIQDADIETYIPDLWKKIQSDPNGGFNKNNNQNRMLRPQMSIKLLKGNTPGIIITSSEVEFLLAEAALKGWNVSGSASDHYTIGVINAMQMLNTNYEIETISAGEIGSYLASNALSSDPEKAKEQINTQAWILHLTNPFEAWANMRRSDYPYIIDRNRYDNSKDFISDSENLTTPTRLMYPRLESKYNKASYDEAIQRLGGTDDWHKRLWWDVYENTHLK